MARERRGISLGPLKENAEGRARASLGLGAGVDAELVANVPGALLERAGGILSGKCDPVHEKSATGHPALARKQVR